MYGKWNNKEERDIARLEGRKVTSKSKALHKMKEGKGKGTGVPKSKWGAKQGNWHKVMPGDR